MTRHRATESLPRVIVTAVGSMPHRDPKEAVELILGTLNHAPHPPQLSRLDPREQMWIQFSEGLPRFRVDLETLTYFFDTSGDPVPDVEAFYNEYMAVTEGGSAEAFDVGPEYGQGIAAFSEQVLSQGRKWNALKLQVTGPISFAMTVTDENRKPIFYHPLFRDVAVKGMGLKAVRLVERFRPFAENVVVFFDEPSLSAYGSSAFLGVSKADVIDSLDDVMNMVWESGAIPGVHCCGNTDWGLLMETSVGIVNFDAVDFMDTMAIYGPQLTDFLASGGVLAWGAVPNTPKIRKETPKGVVERIEAGIDLLAKAGVDETLLRKQIMITPACGCAGLSQSDAELVYRLLGELNGSLGSDTFSKGS